MFTLWLEEKTVAHTRQRGLSVDRPLDSGVAGKGLAGYDVSRMLPVGGKIVQPWARKSYNKN